MQALCNGDLKPLNETQSKFIIAANNMEQPKINYQLIFWKYLNRKKIMNNSKLNNTIPTSLDDREQWKAMRKMMF